MISRIFVFLALAGCLCFRVNANTYTLVTEPDQGLTPIYNLIRSAKNTLDMTMYELTDTQAEQLLAQAASSGVAVRVILDQNLEKSNNTPAFDYLNSHGVQVRWANPKYSATHQKTITVDGSTTAIMTLNLTSQYYRTSRDFAVIENDPNDIAAIDTTFDADFRSGAVQPPAGDDLVWSPTNSQSAILSVINSAGHNLLIENEEMADANVIKALVSAAGRGVSVQVVMTNTGNNYATEFDQLLTAGVRVATYGSSASLYIHAKVIVADSDSQGAQVFVGSENFSSASLTRNRELGLTLSGAALIKSLHATLTRDFKGGTPWKGIQPTITAVVNGASMQPGVPSSAWVTILGASLAPMTDDWTRFIENGELPTSLDGVTVTVGGRPAFPSYVSPSQINAVAPDVGTGTVPVIVSAPNGSVATAMADAETVQPAFFEWGTYAVATHRDFSFAVKNGALSNATVPAAPGEIIILWGTGFGPTNPAAPVGIEVPSDRTYYTASPLAITLGTTPAKVFGGALAPGLAAVYQVVIQIPEALMDGDYPVTATVAGAKSASGLLLTVERPD